MAKSSSGATRSRNPRPSKSTENSPGMPPDAFRPPSAPPIVADMAVPAPHDGLTDAERQLTKFLNRYKIGKRAYEMCAKIGDVIYRAIGGRQRAIETLKFSKNPDAQKLLQFCEKLSWGTRDKIPIEALCLAAEVDPTTIAGALVLAARDVSRLESSLITLDKHPDVVRATAFYAGTADGSKDREMFHKAAVVGWLPTPKGSSINVNVFDPKQVAEDGDDDDGVPTLEGVFGSDPREIEDWGEGRRKLIEAGK
jgi:hypothetical protein